MDAATLAITEEQRIIARERLRLLAIGFYIRAGMVLFFSFFMMLYVAMLIAFSFIPEQSWNNGNGPSRTVAPPAADAATGSATRTWNQQSSSPPKILFRIMASVLGLFIILLWAVAAATVYAARCLRSRRRRLFIQIVAGLHCVFAPYGTLLGVMTFLTLGSPAGRLEFEGDSAAA